MANVNLNTSVLSGGILNTNFFNGRILAAEDLITFQVANAQQHRQLGRAIGDGVAWGLDITLVDNKNMAQPILHITQGLALNRKGEAVSLPMDVDLALVKTADVVSANAGLFAECTPPQGLIPTNLDCYLLTVSPTSGFQGSTPATYPSDSGFAPVCASRDTVEGVKFSMLPLGVSNASASDPTTLQGQAVQLYSQLKPKFVNLVGLTGAAAAAAQAQIAPLLSKFRNVVAHLCFGTDTLATFPANPFPPANGESLFAEYGALDLLRRQGILTDCAVPLALVYWTAAGIQFVDLWSVRRPLFPAPASEAWPVFASRRRLAEGLAIFLQFQEQAKDIASALDQQTLFGVRADDYFQFLPPVGLIPLGGIGSSVGFNSSGFFSGLTTRRLVFIEGQRLEILLRESYSYEPIDLRRRQVMWLYSVRENMQAVGGSAPNRPAAYLVFTSGYIPYKGEPQFDLSYWNFANYALVPRP